MIKKDSKILFVHFYNNLSGSPKVLSQVIDFFIAQGADVSLLTSKSAKTFFTDEFIQKHYYRYKYTGSKIKTLIKFVIIQIYCFLFVIWNRKQFDVLYINTLLPFGASLAGKLCGIPIVTHIHETSLSPAVLKVFLKYVATKCSKKIIYVSNSLRDIENVRSQKEFVLYNAVDSKYLKNVVEMSLCSRYKNPNITMICSLNSYKGVYEFVELAAKCGNLNKNWTFRLVINESKPKCDAWVEKVNPRNVIVLPVQSDLSSVYDSTSVLLNLSRRDECVETFGLTIVEAMASGIPCISPPVGGPAEIVIDNKNGFLVDGKDVDALISKLCFLLEDFSVYKKFSMEARDRVNYFSEDKFNDRLEKLLIQK